MHFEKILELERSLLTKDVRNSASAIEQILEDDFVEYCSSGKIYRYEKGDTLFVENEPNWEIRDFKVKKLSPGFALSTFKVIKHDEPKQHLKTSLRSSIWKYQNERWMIIFHQGTPSVL